MTPTIQFERLMDDALIPVYMTEQAAGMDVYSYINGVIVIYPGEIKIIPTGFKIALQDGFEAQIRPRSGLAIKHGITIINSPGTIDSDYRGEIKIGLINLGNKKYVLQGKQRIAQMVIQQVFRPQIKVVSELNQTQRGSGGFGSTGI